MSTFFSIVNNSPSGIKEALLTVIEKYPDYENDVYQKAAIWKETTAITHDFPLLQQLHNSLFENEPIPITWYPDKTTINNTNIGQAMLRKGFEHYRDFYQWSIDDKKGFWEATISTLGIRFEQTPNDIIKDIKEVESPTWLPGAKMNIVESCFQAPGDHVAIYHQDETSNKISKITYAELQLLVNKAVAGFKKMELQAGDNVVLYVPLSVEAVVVYLGIIKAGMAAVLVADSFSVQELEKRLSISEPSAIVCFDHYLYGGKALDTYKKVKAANAPKAIVINPSGTLRPGDITWDDFIDNKPDTHTHIGDPYDTITVLFSSGTTKAPKAIPWTHLTPIKGASDGYYHHDIHPDDVVTWTTGMGWMMGPWLLFATLINKASLALYTGAASTAAFAAFTEQTGITMMGTIPSLVKAWRSSRVMENKKLNIRLFSSTGEPSNADDYFYLMALCGFKAPVIEYCGGTEIGGGYITGSVVQPASPATFTTPALGLGFTLLKEDNTTAKEHEAGQVYLVPPSIGLSQKLLNRDHHEEYFKDCPHGPQGQLLRRHGDAYEKITSAFGETTFYLCHGRVDDAMNLGGIKIGAVEIEEVINKHPEVNETAAIAVQEGRGPEKLIIYYTAKKEVEGLIKDFQQAISQELNPLFRIAEVIKIDELPRTASNKIMRRKLRDSYLKGK